MSKEQLTDQIIINSFISDQSFQNDTAKKMSEYYCYQVGDGNKRQEGLALVLNPDEWELDHNDRIEDFGCKADTFTVGTIVHNVPDNFDDICLDEFGGGWIDEDLRQIELDNWVKSNYNSECLPYKRVYVPKNENFIDSFSIEVYLTHDNTKIICWRDNVD